MQKSDLSYLSPNSTNRKRSIENPIENTESKDPLSDGYSSPISISKFEPQQNSAVLVLIEPDNVHPETKDILNITFDVYFKVNKEPEEISYDLLYELPYETPFWDRDEPNEIWQIFIPQILVSKLSPNSLYNLKRSKGHKNENLSKIREKSPKSEDRISANHGSHSRRRRSVERKSNSKAETMMVQKNDIWYMGLVMHDRRSVLKESKTSLGYTITIVTPACKKYNETIGKWDSESCNVGDKSNLLMTQCVCPSTGQVQIGTEFISPPNTIDFSSVFANFDVSDNPVVFSTVISFLVVYVGLLFFTRKWDRADDEKWKIRCLADSRPEDTATYHLKISTGNLPGSGTTSHVFIQILRADNPVLSFYNLV